MNETSLDERTLVRQVLRQRRAAAQGTDQPGAEVPIALSFAEERLWFLDRLVPEHAFYNVPLAYRLFGELSVNAWQRALDALVERHETLRTAFIDIDGKPAALRRPVESVPLAYHDLGHLTGDEREQAVRTQLAESARRPFDLTSGRPCRFVLLRLGEREHIFLATVHHIVIDDWSVGVLNRELAELYAAALAGRTAALPPLPASHATIAAAQRNRLTNEALADQIGYWTRQLDGLAGAVPLPADHARPAEPSYRGGEVHFSLDADTAERLVRLGREHDATLFMTLLTAFQSLLARYTNTDDIAVGHPIAGRYEPAADAIIGFFANTLVIRTDTGGNPRFTELLQRVRATAIDAYAHQELPFERLVDQLHPQRDPAQNPLFNVMFTVNEGVGRGLVLPGVDVRVEPVDRDVVKFDLWLGMHRAPDGTLHGTLEYAADLFHRTTIERMAGHLTTLLAHIATDPQTRLGALDLLTGDERAAIDGWNATEVPVPEATLTALIEEQARRTPEAPAVTFGSTSLTYQRLDDLASELAHRLQAAGARPETNVAVVLERSAELPVALLAVLKTGAAYLPLDPAALSDRSRAMLAEAQPVAVIGRSDILNAFGEGPWQSLAWDVFVDMPTAEAVADTPVSVRPDNAAYLIYTSGSTGRPKAVINTHRGIINRLLWMQDAFRLDETDVVIQKTPTTFDVSVWELFWPLMAGARQVVAPVDAHRDPLELLELVERHGITTIHFVPSMLRAFLSALSAGPARRCTSLRRVICSGEELSADLAAALHVALPHVDLHNLYGPTEAAIDVTAYEHRAGDAEVPIGAPIANTDIVIIDHHGQPSPVGIPGELCIGGVNLARGYHRRPDLTADRFVPHPHLPGARLYRTGDLARWRPDGLISYLGRLDDQVKIRGQRVEPGEVAAKIRTYPSISDAAVVAAPGPSGTRLIAYVVPDAAEAAADEREAADQVDEWRQVFDGVHGNSVPRHDPDHPDFSGWISSYTGDPIPAAAMQEWLDTTVTRLLSLQPKRVLELGCGVGVIAHRLAPYVERYHGIDISARALGQLVAGMPAGSEDVVSVQHAAAHELAHLGGERFDLIVANSVVQYFPSGDYLAEVLSTALDHLTPGGALYLGDLRNRDLLLQFHLSVALAKAQPETPAAEVFALACQRADDDRELVVSPGLFAEFTGAEVHVRQGQYDTEMNRYRYDAILRTAPGPMKVPGGKAIQNARIEADAIALRLCAAATSETVGEIRAAAISSANAREVDDLYTLDGCVQVTWTPGSTTGELDVMLSGDDITTPIWRVPVEPSIIAKHVNEPIRVREQRRLLAELRAFLKAQLPDAMVPTAIVPITSLPVSSNGKLDRAALPSPEPWMAGDRAKRRAPGTAAESALAEAWRDILGVADIGVDDNYFELGGDSIQGIQIVTRAAAAGLAITPRMIFQHPTIAGLAAAAKPIGVSLADQGPVVGEVPMLPIQRWFLDAGDPLHDVFGQYALFELRADVDESALERAFADLLDVHDGLRARFDKQDGRWRSRLEAPGGPTPWTALDISGSSVDAAIVTAYGQLHIGDGPLVRALLLRDGDAGSRRLLVVAHHLVVDAVSWTILGSDLATGYRRIVTGQRQTPIRKTASVRQWAKRLARFGEELPVGEGDYWSAQLTATSSSNRTYGVVGDLVSHTVRLSPAYTTDLLDRLPSRHHRVEEVLMTVLGRTLARHTGSDSATVDIERHGRDVVDDLDVSRTVGWFTVLHPMLLPTDPAQDPLRSLTAVKQYLSTIPAGGAGYGLLRYPDEGLPTIPTNAPSVRFNYLGRSKPAVIQSADPWTCPPRLSSWQSPQMQCRHEIEVDAAVVDDQVSVTWRWTGGAHHAAMTELAESYLHELEALIERCGRDVAPIPADFPLALLDQETIDAHFADPAIADIYPLAPIQEGILYEAQAAVRPGVYLEQVTWVQRDLDHERFRAAWTEVIARHGVLRTAFRTDVNDQPLQVVYRTARLPERPTLDWSGWAPEAQRTALGALLAEDRTAGIDITRPPLMRLTVIDLGDGFSRLVFTCHHVILDGWSASLVFSEALQRYDAYHNGRQIEIDVPRPYRDFIATRTVTDAEREFWRGHLGGLAAPDLLQLGPGGDPAAAKGEQRTVELGLEPSLVARVTTFARQNRIPSSLVIQGAWAIVLSRHLRTDEVVFGVTVSGRSAFPDMDRMVGLFVNTVPARVPTKGSLRIGAWLRGLRDQQAERPEHTPLTVIRECAGLSAGDALFDTVLSFDNYPMDDEVRRTLAGAGHETLIEDRNSFGLTVSAELGAEARLRFLFDISRHAEPAVRDLARQLRNVIAELIADPERRLAELGLMTGDSLGTLDDPSIFTGPALMHEAVRLRMDIAAETVAIDDGITAMTYADLSTAAARLADELRVGGCRSDEVVGIFLSRGPDQAIATLAVLSAGAAFLPLDAGQPVERLSRQIADASVRIVITDRALAIDPSVRQVMVGEHGSHPDTAEAAKTPPISGDNVAYVIYTSGSTGQPKGVAVSHRAAALHLRAVAEAYGLAPGDRVLQFSAPTFDISVEQVYATWTAGATLVTPGREWDAGEFLAVATNHGITVANLPAEYWHQLVDELRSGNTVVPDDLSIRMIMLGAEAVDPTMLAQWRQHVGDRVQLLTGYGLTESVITSTLAELPSTSRPERLSVGTTLKGRRLFVLDPHGHPLPPEVTGEILLGGPCLARGYWHRPGLTAERFVPDHLSGEPGGRLYRTGDLGRWRRDGRLELLGRIDRQIKVRGVRVEPAEIEAVLLDHPGVGGAVVMMVAARAGGPNELTGFVVGRGGADIVTEEVRAACRARLPERMVPTVILAIASMPMTQHGKVDHAALTEIACSATPSIAGYRAPKTAFEEIMADVWRDVLGCDRVGVTDDFFDLGGHSLRAMRLVSRLRRTFGVELPLTLIHDYPRMGDMCSAISALPDMKWTDPTIAALLRDDANVSISG